MKFFRENFCVQADFGRIKNEGDNVRVRKYTKATEIKNGPE